MMLAWQVWVCAPWMVLHHMPLPSPSRCTSWPCLSPTHWHSVATVAMELSAYVRVSLTSGCHWGIGPDLSACYYTVSVSDLPLFLFITANVPSNLQSLSLPWRQSSWPFLIKLVLPEIAQGNLSQPTSGIILCGPLPPSTEVWCGFVRDDPT